MTRPPWPMRMLRYTAAFFEGLGLGGLLYALARAGFALSAAYNRWVG